MSLHDLLIGNWTKLGEVAPDSLSGARLQAHFAVQVVAAAGKSLLRARDDDSQTATGWLDRVQALVGDEIPGGLRVGLRIRDLRLLLLTKDGGDLASFALDGRTLDDGIKWLTSQLADETGTKDRPAIVRPDYEMPEHELAKGGKFEAEAERLGALSRWYANADRALQFVAAKERDALQVRCWPHHFDMATLLNLDPYEPAEDARTIGVGMSPGDGSYKQPYYYVTPWPYPDADDLPGLPGGGTWHRQGWTGAILTGAKLMSATTAERQVEMLTEFLEGAIAACKELHFKSR
ncbi:MAG: hypothetical protein H6839_03140 [Planctomycetes bacterium]|nr:hypothetical protein [Planctomycetota bacterium]